MNDDIELHTIPEGGRNSSLPPASPNSQAPIMISNTPTEVSAAEPNDPKEAEQGAKPELTKQEKKELWRYRIRIIFGLTLPFFLDAIDTTIISTALPHIAADFNQLSQQSWIVTAFTITGTAFIPAFGQLCDVFGRHTVLQFSLFLMWVGSALCAGAQHFAMLLVGRAITGVSSSGLLVVTTIVLGDKVSLKENALQNTLFSLVAGVSYGVGPVIGGYLTSVHWRWCFGLSIPISLVSHILVFFCLRPILVKAQTTQELSRTDSGGTMVHHRDLTFLQKLAVVDWEGIIVFIASCVCVILALTWGGTTYAWDSPQIIVLLVVGGALFFFFLLVEKGMEDDGWIKSWGAKRGWMQSRRAMIPLKLFHSKDVCILAFVNFSGGVSLFAMFYFIATYFAIVESYPPARAGLQLLYYLPGIGLGVYYAMYLCNSYPAQTFPPIFIGTAIAVPIAIGLLTRALDLRESGFIIGMMILCGFGNGVTMMPVPLHAIARKPRQLASVVATLQFFDPFGGTVALAMMGSVLNNKVGGSGIGGLLRQGGGEGAGDAHQGRLVGDLLDNLPKEVQETVKSAVKEGVVWAFISVLPILVLAAVLTLGLGNVKIDLRGLDDRIEEQDMNEAAAAMDDGGWRGVFEREKLALVQYWEEYHEKGWQKALDGVLRVLLLKGSGK